MPCRHDISLLVNCPYCEAARERREQEKEASWKQRALAAEALLAEVRKLLSN